MTPTLYFLTGPTAVGKTELSLRWAETRNFPVVILSCDSLLVYRGMDIGTAKPDPQDRERVAHYGLDLVEPWEPFTIVDYVEYARDIVADLTREGTSVLVTGGSGFYLKSFFEPVLDPVHVPEPVTRMVRSLYRERGLGAMVARIKALNPGGLGDLEIRNPRRVMRALERCLASGKQLPELQEEFRSQPRPFPEYEKKVCLLTRSREILQERIEKRTRTMLQAGLVDEVKRLQAQGFEKNPSAAGSIGYRETLRYLENPDIGLNGLEAAINQETRKLLKKQRSWFRKQIPVDCEMDLDRLEDRPALEQLFVPG